MSTDRDPAPAVWSQLPGELRAACTTARVGGAGHVGPTTHADIVSAHLREFVRDR